MKKYFYSDGKEKDGPLSLDELKHENITNNTLIWFEGLDDWTPAKYIQEMKPILELKPPPMSTFNKELEMQVEAPTEKESIVNHGGSMLRSKQGMFSRAFSFDGRIGRMEYGSSLIIYAILGTYINPIVESGEAPLIGLAYFPMLWFLWAQGAKRCHDIGNNGWWQIVPFYVLWMLFQKGEPYINKYGINPKE